MLPLGHVAYSDYDKGSAGALECGPCSGRHHYFDLGAVQITTRS